MVLKGTQRQMIKISGCADTVFEEAYFVLRTSVDRENMSQHDLIAEANRIIRENSYLTDNNNTSYVKISPILLWLLVGMSTAGMLLILLLLIGVL